MNGDDTLIAKLIQDENDGIRDVTGQESDEVPAHTPVSYTSRGRVD